MKLKYIEIPQQHPPSTDNIKIFSVAPKHREDKYNLVMGPL